jgi:hypothetical protein
MLSAIDAGDPRAAVQLLPLVYDELRKLSAAKPARAKPGQTLDAAGLAPEAHTRQVGVGNSRIGVIGTGPRPRPCAASWSKTLAAPTQLRSP